MDTKIGFHFNNANASLKIDGHQVDLAGPKDTKEVIGKDGRLKTIEGFVAQDGTFFQVKEGKTGGIDIIVRGTPEQLASYDFGVKNGSVSSARYGENRYRPGAPVAASDFTIKSGTSGKEILSEHGMVEKQPRVSKEPSAPVINENPFSSAPNPPTETDLKKLQQKTSDAITANRDRMREMMKEIPLVTGDRKAPSSPQSTAKTAPQPSVEIPKMEAHPPVKDDVENPRNEEVPYDPKPSDIEQLEGIPLPFARARSSNNGQVDSEKPLVGGQNLPGPSVPSKGATAEAKLSPELREQLSELRVRIGSLPEGDKDKNLAGVLDGAIMRHATERAAIASETGPVSESFRKVLSEYKELKQTHDSVIAELTTMLKNQQGKTLKQADLRLQQEKTVELRGLTASLQESREKLVPLQRDAQNLLSRRDRNDRNLESVMGMVSNRLNELGVQNPSMVPGNIQIQEDYFASSSSKEGAIQQPLQESLRIDKNDKPDDPSIDPFSADFGEVDSTRMATELEETVLDGSESLVSDAELKELEVLEAQSLMESGNIPDSPIVAEEGAFIPEDSQEISMEELDQIASQPLSPAELLRSAFPEQMARVDRKNNPAQDHL